MRRAALRSAGTAFPGSGRAVGAAEACESKAVRPGLARGRGWGAGLQRTQDVSMGLLCGSLREEWRRHHFL